jgi:hypothetical protein
MIIIDQVVDGCITVYDMVFSKYYYLTIGILLIVLTSFYLLYLNYELIELYVPKNSKLFKSIKLIDNKNNKNNNQFNQLIEFKKLDKKCYNILYNVNEMIGSQQNLTEENVFNDSYLLKLNEAKNIFYSVKRNKKLVKSNYILLKILNKIKNYNIDKNDIDDTIIYLIILVLNK